MAPRGPKKVSESDSKAKWNPFGSPGHHLGAPDFYLNRTWQPTWTPADFDINVKIRWWGLGLHFSAQGYQNSVRIRFRKRNGNACGSPGQNMDSEESSKVDQEHGFGKKSTGRRQGTWIRKKHRTSTKNMDSRKTQDVDQEHGFGKDTGRRQGPGILKKHRTSTSPESYPNI